METISVNREYDAPEHRLRSVFEEATAFFDAAGFDVDRTHDRLVLSKQVAITQFDLHVKLRKTESATLAYEQVSGPFREMTTHYHVDSSATGSCLTIETSFEPPATGFGSFLNEPVIKQQRRMELDAVASLLKTNDETSGQKTEDPSVTTGGD